jgi:hypothetical protein
MGGVLRSTWIQLLYQAVLLFLSRPHVLRGSVEFANRVPEEVKNGMQEGSFPELVIDDHVIQ